jgi:hypothetical protein
VEPETFDALLERVARQTTRRAALATLLGGALLLHAPAASEATKEAQRSKDHRKRGSLKPISVLVHNPGTNPVTVQHGWWRTQLPFGTHCMAINTVPIPPGGALLFRSPQSVEYLWINETFWVDFRNPELERPDVSAAVDGSRDFYLNLGGCPRRGTTVLSQRAMSEGTTVNFTINGKVFSAHRKRDSNYKEFTLTLPPIL